MSLREKLARRLYEFDDWSMPWDAAVLIDHGGSYLARADIITQLVVDHNKQLVDTMLTDWHKGYPRR